MKNIFPAILLLLIQHYAFSQNYYVAFNPLDCSNCVKGIEAFINKESTTFVFQKQFESDSNSLRTEYLFSNTAQLIFSDSLFDQYATDGRSTISNERANFKVPATAFNKTASLWFDKLNSHKDADTLQFNFPISKSSISKYQFTNTGKVYLYDMLAHSIILFDVLNNKVSDTLTIDIKDTKKAFELFSKGDTAAYNYYKTGLSKITNENIAIIKDFSVFKDTLAISVSNTFFFTGGAKGIDTFVAKFMSVGLYKNGKYIKTVIPEDIKVKLLHKDVPFTSEPENIYYFNGNIYTSINNHPHYPAAGFYSVGRYSDRTKKYDWATKLNPKYYTDFNFSNPFFSDQYFILSKSPEVFNTNSGTGVDLNYFRQEDMPQNGPIIYPKYFNRDLNVDNKFYNILFYSNAETCFYYARIDKTDNKLLVIKKLPPFDKMRVKIDPYNNNFILAFWGPNKIIRYRVF
ncbi:hypothetical protein D3C71_84730 [compost metagenome]